jgi:hypothetical protein
MNSSLFGSGGKLVIASALVGWLTSMGACGGKALCTDPDGKCDSVNRGAGANGTGGIGSRDSNGSGPSSNAGGATPSSEGNGTGSSGLDCGYDHYLTGGAGGSWVGSGGSTVTGFAGSVSAGPDPCASPTSTDNRNIVDFDTWSDTQSGFQDFTKVSMGAWSYDAYAISVGSMVAGHAPPSAQAFGVAGLVSTPWAGIAVPFLECTDARRWDGMTFWVKGEGAEMQVDAWQHETMDTSMGQGKCCGGQGLQCFHPVWHFFAEAGWHQYTVTWDQFENGRNNDRSVPFDPSRIVGLNFGWTNSNGATSFSLALDDVAFFSRE